MEIFCFSSSFVVSTSVNLGSSFQTPRQWPKPCSEPTMTIVCGKVGVVSVKRGVRTYVLVLSTSYIIVFVRDSDVDHRDESVAAEGGGTHIVLFSNDAMPNSDSR